MIQIVTYVLSAAIDKVGTGSIEFDEFIVAGMGDESNPNMTDHDLTLRPSQMDKDGDCTTDVMENVTEDGEGQQSQDPENRTELPHNCSSMPQSDSFVPQRGEVAIAQPTKG